MKLSEALILRADCQRRISAIKQRLERSSKVQEGEDSPEDPDLLLDELTSVINEVTSLIKKINKTNNIALFDETKTISEALADRDALAMERDALDDLIDEATVKYDRYSRSEVKFISQINVKVIQKKKDDISMKYRQLDFKIQEKNWSVDLIEN